MASFCLDSVTALFVEVLITSSFFVLDESLCESSAILTVVAFKDIFAQLSATTADDVNADCVIADELLNIVPTDALEVWLCLSLVVVSLPPPCKGIIVICNLAPLNN